LSERAKRFGLTTVEDEEQKKKARAKKYGMAVEEDEDEKKKNKGLKDLRVELMLIWRMRSTKKLEELRDLEFKLKRLWKREGN